MNEPNASRRMIEANDLTKRYGALEVLRGISLDVNRGEVKVVVGPSGSGKSTMLRCLALLEPIDSGAILLDGQDVSWRERRNGGRERSERSLVPFRSQLCMVFQHFNLFPHMTALENVMVGPVHVRRIPRAQAEAEAMALLRRVRLADKAGRYPHELSGGQQQRVAIARALALRPKVMLFDEPTSALDPELVREVVDVMEELAQDGMTMVVVSHEMRFAHEAADQIVMMDEGRIIEEAPPEQFFSAPAHERTRQFLQLVES
ncbi:MAG TPA: amino acid ABC transporter ATP-binding protein [Thermomicrobiales bacterium]|jgi:polar amino acid transport system ATP-binding protein|nr:amino acid ABC transporter ATP-binding protein [Thermomicrobiales bacterium]